MTQNPKNETLKFRFSCVKNSLPPPSKPAELMTGASGTLHRRIDVVPAYARLWLTSWYATRDLSSSRSPQ